MATFLVKQQTVLLRTEVFEDGTACYEQMDDEFLNQMPRPIRSLFVNRAMAEEMGNPAAITLTIEAGDTLNKEKK